MKKFVETNGRVDVVNLHEGHLKDTFSPGVYVIKQDMSGLFLQKDMDKFDMPERIYGSTNRRAEKIMNTFSQREGTTGVLLTGVKGAGKTFLMKKVGNLAIEAGLPVILVNDPYTGSDFISFLNSFGECVIIFDEFAKNYKRNGGENGQESLLTLFDGVSSGKRIIMLSENNSYDISHLYKDRPSRVYYAYRYEKIEKDMVKEYCEDNLVNKDFTSKILLLSDRSYEFSFDILQSVVEECNRYPDEDFDEIIADLNISAAEDMSKFEIKEVVGYSGQVEGMKFIPRERIIPYYESEGSTTCVAQDILPGQEAPQRRHVEIAPHTFIEVAGEDYIFIDGDLKIIGRPVRERFSEYRGVDGYMNSAREFTDLSLRRVKRSPEKEMEIPFE